MSHLFQIFDSFPTSAFYKVMHLGCSVTFNDCFIIHLLLILTVTEL